MAGLSGVGEPPYGHVDGLWTSGTERSIVFAGMIRVHSWLGESERKLVADNLNWGFQLWDFSLAISFPDLKLELVSFEQSIVNFRRKEIVFGLVCILKSCHLDRGCLDQALGGACSWFKLHVGKEIMANEKDDAPASPHPDLQTDKSWNVLHRL